MSLDTPLHEKRSFYAQIDTLNVTLRDEDEYLGDDLGLRKKSRAFFAQLQRVEQKASKFEEEPPTLTEGISTQTPLIRATNLPVTISNCASTMVKATPFTVERHTKESRRSQYLSSTSFVENTPFQNPLPSIISRLQRSATTPGSLSSITTTSAEQSPSVMSSTHPKKRATKGRGKGKAKEIDMVPEGKQILKGLRFFYVRKERVSIRKSRMERAEQYGAVVTQKLPDCTHVIVDDDLKYDEIKSLIAPTLGKDGPLVAGAQWPLNCIHENRILPVSAKYRVRGMPALEEIVASNIQIEPSTTTQASERSLQVKSPHNNPNRWDYVPPRTPSQSDALLVQRADKRKAESMSLEAASTQETGEKGVIIPSSQVVPQKEYQNSGTEKKARAQYPASSGEGDELSHLISRVREEFKDLPRLGEEDGFFSPEGNEYDDNTDDERSATRSVRKRRKPGGKARWPKSDKTKKFEDHFACNRGGTKDQASSSDNPNARTIAVLQQMLGYYEQTNDHWRLRAYRNAINTLSRATTLITTAEEAEELPWFGKRLAQKLEEIVNTNTLQRLEYALLDPTSKTLSLFLGIYGVGKATADKWMAQGFRTLEDLTQHADLNANQKIGIDHYEDLNSRIPRAEVTQLGELVRAEAARIDGAVKLLIGGSYRRGADSSGDVDFILTKPGTTSSDDLVPFLERLVGHLTETGFLTAELASHNFGRDDGGSKWHGCCALPPPDNNLGSDGSSSSSYRPVWRRIDFLLVPETEYGAALIYFTGNDIFNRSIRLLASKKGMRLNQRGLYKDVLRGTYGRQKLSTGEFIEGQDERKIFEILGVKWREPEERWC